MRVRNTAILAALAVAIFATAYTYDQHHERPNPERDTEPLPDARPGQVHLIPFPMLVEPSSEAIAIRVREEVDRLLPIALEMSMHTSLDYTRSDGSLFTEFDPIPGARLRLTAQEDRCFRRALEGQVEEGGTLSALDLREVQAACVTEYLSSQPGVVGTLRAVARNDREQ